MAVLDSGVADHPDLNVSARVDIIPPPANCTLNVRDEFNSASFSANDGTSAWAGDWVEYDAAGAGASAGNVTITGGELLLDDRPNTGTQPSAARSVDLSQAASATFSFDFRTGSGVEADEDRIAVDVSDDGGLTYTTLEIFETYEGAVTGSRSYDLTPYLSADTRIRFRVYELYGGPSEYFAVDNVEISAELCDPDDPFGHGTHIAGTIAGTGLLSNGVNHGIASAAAIVALRVLDEQGQGNISDIIAALDWILQNGAAQGIDVVNLSLGKAVEESAALDPLVQAAEAVWDAGFTVVASAGNYGRDGNFTITSPGNSPKLITTGSLTDEETGEDFSDDYVSTYSSRGPTLTDHFAKPDLLAPGNRVVSTTSADAKLVQDNPDRVVLDNYGVGLGFARSQALGF